MPLDSYFTAKPKKHMGLNALTVARWKRFQRLSHSEQAKAVDKLLQTAKERELTEAEDFIVRQWELKRSPWII